MISKIKIWHLITIYLLLILILRIEALINIYRLIIYFAADIGNSIQYADTAFLDYTASAVLIILIPAGAILLRNRLKFLSYTAGLPSAFLIILLSFFIFAPLISNGNPAFSKNIGVSKLLPPFSALYTIELNEKTGYDFLSLKRKIIKESFDAGFLYADSVDFKRGIIYQEGDTLKINKAAAPVVAKKIFVLGTDEFGRDVFTRLVYGTRTSLLIGLGSVVVSLIIGLLLGFIAGYYGGIMSLITSRLNEMFLIFPLIFLIILILSLFGNTLLSVIIVLGFSGWMSLFKIIKSEVASVKQTDYFIAASVLGLPKRKLLINEILPVIKKPMLINLIFLYGSVILAESTLSFLGLGAGQNYPSWGSMIEAGQEYLTKAWWMILSPSLLLICTLITANAFSRKTDNYD